MNSACASVLPNTKVLNCMWHAHTNLRQNLQSSLGDKWTPFLENFFEVCRSLTPKEFDARWAHLLKEYGDEDDDKDQDENQGQDDGDDDDYDQDDDQNDDNGQDDDQEGDGETAKAEGNITRYLRRLYTERVHWGWPWMRTIFTAGMKSTQRVEKTHHFVKSVGLHTRSSFVDVPRACEEKVTNEQYSIEYIQDEEGVIAEKEASGPASPMVDMFQPIIVVNDRLLGEGARNKIRNELEWSFNYIHDQSDLEDFLRDVNASV
ncbi:hypothetical protein B0O80DRAFT_44240 [Mortierella sp. GBAus27b]|nr:hypothetical protein B0O80DRAFT_44240 [Mortierella sp. GBAus27b]